MNLHSRRPARAGGLRLLNTSSAAESWWLRSQGERSAPRWLSSITHTARQALLDERIALLPLRCVHRARRSRQLQHGCVLAFAQPGEQHGLPVGELKRIVMHARLAHVDLPKLCHFLLELPVLHQAYNPAELWHSLSQLSVN